jgi:hypothetical protein
MPDDKLPVVTFLPSGLGATYNDPALTTLAVAGFKAALGEANVIETTKILGADETNAFSRAYLDPVPMLFYFYGSTDPAALAASKDGGSAVASLHTPEFAPDLHASIETGTKSLVGVVLSVLAQGRQ